jgi:hypothetical protein
MLRLGVRTSHQLATLNGTAVTASREVVPSMVRAATRIASLAMARDEAAMARDEAATERVRAATEKANAVTHRPTGLTETAVRHTDSSQAARARRTAPAAIW